MVSNYRQRLHGDLMRKAGSQSVNNLSIDDLAVTIADAIKDERHRILEHVGRVVKLIEVKVNTHSEKRRVDILFRRVMQIDSELRRMARKT